jgi:hypothetical protein
MSLLLLKHFCFTIIIFILQRQFLLNLVGFSFLNLFRLSFNQVGIFMNGIQIYLFALIIKYLVNFVFWDQLFFLLIKESLVQVLFILKILIFFFCSDKEFSFHFWQLYSFMT